MTITEDSGLVISNLSVMVGPSAAVNDISFSVSPGERVGIVGESGSGKSLTALSVMGLLPPGLTTRGEVRHAGRNLLEMNDRQLSKVRGKDLSMIFQDSLSALNPTKRVGLQIAELARRHRSISRSESRKTAVDLINEVGLPRADDIFRTYPHQLSGGQRQRVLIAMAIASSPQLIIADEPTTALDSTVQKRILALLSKIVDETGSALILISHDVPVVAMMCDRVIVMYGGRIVEEGTTETILRYPKHPYTQGLLDSQITPEDIAHRTEVRLRSIPGSVPAVGDLPSGCAFRPRCPRATDACTSVPLLEGTHHRFACWNPVPTESRQDLNV